jgi:hypothetical protein
VVVSLLDAKQGQEAGFLRNWALLYRLWQSVLGVKPFLFLLEPLAEAGNVLKAWKVHCSEKRGKKALIP